jgi:threonine 3-dehydrogenase
MRALLKEQSGPGMVLREVPVPRYGPADVLIKVHHAGVCGTDLHIWEWDAWASQRLKPPVVIGHEFAGEIVEVGAEARAAGLLHPGDLVTAEGHIVCGHCLQCRLGDAHLCRRTQVIGVDRDGAFAEYIAMPASNVMKLAGIPTEIGAVMDPVGNAVHTVLEGSVAGARVLVIGCGPIGCFAVGVARAAGASLVVASDLNPRRLELACQMGAHVTLDAGREDVVARVRELTGGDGADLVCEMSGHPAACTAPGTRCSASSAAASSTRGR